MELNGNYKKIRNVLAAFASLIVLSAVIWTYVENRIEVERELCETVLRIEFDKKLEKIKSKIELVRRLDELRDSERRLEKLLKSACPDKAPLQKEYDCIQKSIQHIEKKFAHEK